jgi:hypothetical protein
MTNKPEIPKKEIALPERTQQQEEKLQAVSESAQTEPAQAAEPVVVKRVMVIDDELAGLTKSHLSTDIQELLTDLSSPLVAELWEMAVNLKGFKPYSEADPQEIRAYLSSDRIIQEIILTPYFEEKCSAALKQSLSSFLSRASSVTKLKEFIHAAFCAPAYELGFMPDRPMQTSVLLDYDLVIFDLMLEKSVKLVTEVVGYLKDLGEKASLSQLPCIIIMSSRSDLITERMRFSHESNISAAGLLILPKSEVLKDEFGSAGLSLSYHQLERQREIAQNMRLFMRTWTGALEDARSRASKTMWNLDAAAMQEFHHVAFNDHDPYDEYLNALMMREYLWHVEAVPAVTEAIDSLDKIFQAQFKTPIGTTAIIERRFIAPFVKPENGRELVKHLTWTGFALPPPLYEMEEDKAVEIFGKAVPFGSLLAPNELKSDTECLVHITQQCDLNQSNGKQYAQSVQFTVVLPVEVKSDSIPAHNSEDLVARGLHFNGKEYDFVLAKGRQIALPIPEFVKYAKNKGLNVIGRLRHDIATHFLLATANHMTRWASQKVSHVEVKSVNLYMHGGKFPNGSVVFENGAEKFVQIAKSNKLWYFQDDTSMHIALWMNAQLTQHYGESNLDIAKLCNQLSVGSRPKDCLMKFIDFNVENVKTENVKDRLSQAKAPRNDRVTLFAIYNEE